MLARYGWAASVTRDGLARTDVLAVHTVTRRMVEVQVKTIRVGASWPLGNKGLVTSDNDHEWYVFVRLGKPPVVPETWIVPRNHVAAATWVQHMAWLHDPTATPGKRNVGVDRSRVHEETFNAYRDRWDDLHHPTEDLAVRLPSWMQDWLDVHADDDALRLPANHPWWRAKPRWVEPSRS